MVLPSLWVTSGEGPAKERFANVHYRRAFLLAISQPELSWTRVNLNATWNPDATVNAGLDFKFAFNAQVHAHVKGPAGPCSIWHPWPTCDCPIGGGFGTSVGTSGDKGGTIG